MRFSQEVTNLLWRGMLYGVGSATDDFGDEIIIVSLPVAGYSYYTKISCVETNTVNVLEEGSRFTCG